MKNNYLNSGLHLILILLIIFFILPQVSAGVWDIDLDIPSYDPLWKQISNLWKFRSDIDNINRVISLAGELKKKYPEKPDPLLWQGLAYKQKAFRCDCSRDERINHLKEAVSCAVKANAIKKSQAAFRIFISSAMAFNDINDILDKYRGWIMEYAPLPGGRALPEMNFLPEWKEVVKIWDGRKDIKQGHAAAAIFKKIADRERGMELAQLWACRSLFYLGNYYNAEMQIEKGLSYFRESASYGERALKINPESLYANYWYFVSYARVIEDATLFEKAIHASSILDYILFCYRENHAYYYFGPVMIAAGALVKGGWVTEKIMESKGYTLHDMMTGLDLAEVLYPDFFPIPLCRAQLLINMERKREAADILKKLIARDPDVSRYQSAENRIIIKIAKLLLKDIK